CQQYNSFPLSF
nr:immunoglobulin light chain junction region [Macaca mulatta]